MFLVSVRYILIQIRQYLYEIIQDSRIFSEHSVVGGVNLKPAKQTVISHTLQKTPSPKNAQKKSRSAETGKTGDHLSKIFLQIANFSLRILVSSRSLTSRL